MKKAFASIVAILTLSSVAFAGGNYKLEVKPPASAKKGEKATAIVHVNGTGEFHMNLEYPSKLTITAPAGVKVEKPKQEKADAKKLDKDALEFAVDFTSADAGKKSFEGELKFAICKTTDCAPQSEKVKFDVDVK